MIFRKEAGQSTPGGACLLNCPDNRITATRDRRVESRVTTALTKWVVPIVTLATEDGATEADLNMVVIALAIPWLGSVVVGALCLRNEISFCHDCEELRYQLHGNKDGESQIEDANDPLRCPTKKTRSIVPSNNSSIIVLRPRRIYNHTICVGSI
jgi:hypothetical protein